MLRDGVDNDADGYADFPADPGCESLQDSSETSPISSVTTGWTATAMGTWIFRTIRMRPRRTHPRPRRLSCVTTGLTTTGTG